jgi:hypothetical protein
MTDLTNLDNDELGALAADLIHEIETRVEASHHARKRIWRIRGKRLHADLEELQEELYEAGEISTRSGGSKTP